MQSTRHPYAPPHPGEAENALATIERDLGFYLTTTAMSRAVARAVSDRLVSKLRALSTENVLSVVESFAFPSELLSVPIADRTAWRDRMN